MAKELPNLKDVSRIPEELLPVVQWWQESGPKTATIVAVILALCSAGVYLWNRAERTADEAAIALPAASTVADYDTIVQMGTDAQSVAQLDLARALFIAGDYAEALATYEAAAKALDAQPALKDIATLGRICTLEALGLTDEALTAAELLEPSITLDAPTHYLAGEFLMAKARLLCVKGNKDAAKATLAPLVDAKEESPLHTYQDRAKATLRMIAAYTGKPLAEPAPAPAPEAPAAEPTPAPEASAAEQPAPEATPAPEAASVPETPVPAPEAPAAQ